MLSFCQRNQSRFNKLLIFALCERGQVSINNTVICSHCVREIRQVLLILSQHRTVWDEVLSCWLARRDQANISVTVTSSRLVEAIMPVTQRFAWWKRSDQYQCYCHNISMCGRDQASISATLTTSHWLEEIRPVSVLLSQHLAVWKRSGQYQCYCQNISLGGRDQANVSATVTAFRIYIMMFAVK